MILTHLVQTKTSRYLYFAVGLLSTLILYRSSNRIQFITPEYLPMQDLDLMMPFLPWTVWVYFTEYIIFLFPVFGLRSGLNVTKYFYSYMFILTFSVLVFFAYPTVFPRENYPLDLYPDGFTKTFFTFLRVYMDAPTNCLPSLHVSSCYISAFAFWRENKKVFYLLTAWSTLVAISTMTTKQHYFVDIWTALLLTTIAYFIFFNKVSYSKPSSQ